MFGVNSVRADQMFWYEYLKVPKKMRHWLTHTLSNAKPSKEDTLMSINFLAKILNCLSWDSGEETAEVLYEAFCLWVGAEKKLFPILRVFFFIMKNVINCISLVIKSAAATFIQILQEETPQERKLLCLGLGSWAEYLQEDGCHPYFSLLSVELCSLLACS